MKREFGTPIDRSLSSTFNLTIIGRSYALVDAEMPLRTRHNAIILYLIIGGCMSAIYIANKPIIRQFYVYDAVSQWRVGYIVVPLSAGRGCRDEEMRKRQTTAPKIMQRIHLSATVRQRQPCKCHAIANAKATELLQSL